MPAQRNDLLRYRFRVAGREYDEDLANQIQLAADPEGINQAIVDSAGKYAHWATLEVFAKAEVDEVEELLAILEAELFETYTEKLKTDKVTAVNKAVKCDPKRVALCERVRKARETLGLIRVGVKTIDKYTDSAFEVAYNMRKEMEVTGRGSRVRERARDAEDRASKVFES